MKKGGNIFYYKFYLQSLLRKFAVKTFNMPKSMSTIQNQISGCERNVKESLSQCAELVGDRNYTFSFSLSAFVKDITTLNLDDSLKHMRMVQEDKRNKFTSVTNFDEWVNGKCCVKKTRARQLRMFYNRFKKYIKVLQCKLTFIWFVCNGAAIRNYIKNNEEESVQWV